jgi:hypothetical protein
VGYAPRRANERIVQNYGRVVEIDQHRVMAEWHFTLQSMIQDAVNAGFPAEPESLQRMPSLDGDGGKAPLQSVSDHEVGS